MPQDDLDPIPSMSATRDDDPVSQGRARQGASPRGNGGSRRPEPRSGGGAGLFARLCIALALGIAGVACAWAWQLQEQLKQGEHEMARYEKRVKDLEDLLSDTDETVNQSSAAMGAQLRMLDSEVRKLWDARKVSNNTLAQVEKTSKANAGQLATQSKASKEHGASLKTLSSDVATFKQEIGDMERLARAAANRQAEIERLADSVNRFNLELSKMDKRVASNEEWVQSINAFRGQVNAALTRLQSSVTALQSPGG